MLNWIQILDTRVFVIIFIVWVVGLILIYPSVLTIQSVSWLRMNPKLKLALMTAMPWRYNAVPVR